MNIARVAVSDVINAIRERIKINHTLSGSTEAEIMSSLFEASSGSGPNTDLYYIQKNVGAAIAHGLTWGVLKATRDKVTGETRYSVPQSADEREEYRMLSRQCMADFSLRQELAAEGGPKEALGNSSAKMIKNVAPLKEGKRKIAREKREKGTVSEAVHGGRVYKGRVAKKRPRVVEECVAETVNPRDANSRGAAVDGHDHGDSDECKAVLGKCVKDFLRRREASRHHKKVLRSAEKPPPLKYGRRRQPIRRKLLEMSIIDEDDRIKKFIKTGLALSQDRLRPAHFRVEDADEQEYGLAYRSCDDTKKQPKRKVNKVNRVLRKEDHYGAGAKRNCLNRHAGNRCRSRVGREPKRQIRRKGSRGNRRCVAKKERVVQRKWTAKEERQGRQRKLAAPKRNRKPRVSSYSDQSTDEEEPKPKPTLKKAPANGKKRKREHSSSSDCTSNSSGGQSHTSCSDCTTDQSDRRSSYTGSSSDVSTANSAETDSKGGGAYRCHSCGTQFADYFACFANRIRYQELHDDEDDFSLSDETDSERRPRDGVQEHGARPDGDSDMEDNRERSILIGGDDAAGNCRRIDEAQDFVRRLVGDLAETRLGVGTGHNMRANDETASPCDVADGTVCVPAVDTTPSTVRSRKSKAIDVGNVKEIGAEETGTSLSKSSEIPASPPSGSANLPQNSTVNTQDVQNCPTVSKTHKSLKRKLSRSDSKKKGRSNRRRATLTEAIDSETPNGGEEETRASTVETPPAEEASSGDADVAAEAGSTDSHRSSGKKKDSSKSRVEKVAADCKPDKGAEGGDSTSHGNAEENNKSTENDAEGEKKKDAEDQEKIKEDSDKSRD